jgi:hypothetical protein
MNNYGTFITKQKTEAASENKHPAGFTGQSDWLTLTCGMLKLNDLDIQIPDRFGVRLDEFAAGIHRVPHQHIKCTVRLSRILHRDE